MSKPIIFISHKTSDTKIATALADFCRRKAGGRVQVYLSSNADFKGPKLGKGLNAQLKQALWNTDVLLLVYTSDDQEWSYCMWECGVASDSQSPETNTIVFQCGSDYPDPLNDLTRVNVRNPDDIKKFVGQFLRDEGFFPSLKEPLLTDYTDDYVKDDSTQLYQDFAKVLPKIEGFTQDWSTWPYLRIELPHSEVDKMNQASEAERDALSHQIVTDFGIVTASDPRAAQLFGQSTFQARMPLQTLLKTWKDKNPNADATWFDSCCKQIMIGAARGFPVIHWTSIRQPGSDDNYTPVVSRIRSRPFADTVLFDVYFYNLTDPRAIPVTSKMMPAGSFFHKKLGEMDLQKLKLADLINELKTRQLNRVPILSSDSHPMYIVHRSMIDKFIVESVLSPDTSANPANLTLADLLGNPEMKTMFENTFVVVKRTATLAEAQSAMVTKPGCSDVFVTVGGNAKEPVQGWLTNVDITRVA